MSERKDEGEIPVSGRGDINLGGLFGGLANIVGKLADLAQRAEELSKSGETEALGKEVRGVYGFSVKVGLGGEGLQVEPFGTVGKPAGSPRAEVREIREPIVDVFEEDDHILVVAEMPGVNTDDVRIEVKDDILDLSAERGEKRYRKEVLLPGSFAREKMTITSNNGVVEIRCAR